MKRIRILGIKTTRPILPTLPHIGVSNEQDLHVHINLISWLHSNMILNNHFLCKSNYYYLKCTDENVIL